jgi:hypothetical protein
MDTNKTAKLQTTQISDTLSNLKDTNPILLDGQIAIARDTNNTYFTVGNGTSNFNNLPLEIVGNYGSMIPDYKNVESTNRLSISDGTTSYVSTGNYELRSNSWTCDKVGFIYIYVNAIGTGNNFDSSIYFYINDIYTRTCFVPYSNYRINFSGIFPINKGDIIQLRYNTTISVSATFNNIMSKYIPPIFISDEEMINTALINRPDKWIVGTEYNFGDGLYGQRFTGSFNISSTSPDYTGNLANATRLIQYGGDYYDANVSDSGRLIIGTNYNNSHYHALIIFVHRSTNQLRIAFSTNSTTGTWNYDVWCKYIK